MTEPNWHAPVRCPACNCEAGRPCRVESRSASQVVVIVRCGECGHEWKIDRETTAPPIRAPLPIDDSLER